jgi:hypothetical protein
MTTNTSEKGLEALIVVQMTHAHSLALLEPICVSPDSGNSSFMNFGPQLPLRAKGAGGFRA